MTNGDHEQTAGLSSPDALAESTRTVGLSAEPSSATAARRFVLAALDEWGGDELREDAAICATELATNAILHSRDRFTVAVRPSSHGARIDVLDCRPDRLPVAVPDVVEPMDTGTTGRGLMLIAALAEQWGFFTTDVAKTVWVELSAAGPAAGPTEPVVQISDRPEDPGAISTELIDLPVRVAIASGVQVDELVREIQLYRLDLSAADRATFEDLLERSARPRLLGRQEAFRAAAEGHRRVSVRLTARPEELAAVAELSVLLDRLTDDPRRSVGAVGDEVHAMRAWINTEVVAQQSGATPTPYAGPEI